jgi:hypothetical protein
MSLKYGAAANVALVCAQHPSAEHLQEPHEHVILVWRPTVTDVSWTALLCDTIHMLFNILLDSGPMEPKANIFPFQP